MKLKTVTRNIELTMSATAFDGRKKTIILTFLALICIGQCYGKKQSKEPAGSLFLYSSAPAAFNVSDVVQNDTATILTLEYSGLPGESVSIPKGLYLEDREGKVYPLRSSAGIAPGMKTRCPLMGRLRFSLCFEPMARGKEFFDLHSANTAFRWFSFWGIHRPEVKAKRFLSSASVKEKAIRNPAPEGMVTIKGHISSHKSMPGKVILHYSSISGSGAQAEAVPADDGSFEITQQLDGEVMSYLMLGMRYVPVYLYPSDTLYVEISDDSGQEMKASYRSARGNDTHENLLKALSPRITSWDGIARQRISPSELTDEVARLKREDAIALRYLTWKYGLNDQETHLLHLRMNIRCLEAILSCLSTNAREAISAEEFLQLSREERKSRILSQEAKEYYHYVRDLDLDDVSYFILNPIGLYSELGNIYHVTLSRSLGNRDNMFETLEYYAGQRINDNWRKRLMRYM